MSMHDLKDSWDEDSKKKKKKLNITEPRTFRDPWWKAMFDRRRWWWPLAMYGMWRLTMAVSEYVAPELYELMHTYEYDQFRRMMLWSPEDFGGILGGSDVHTPVLLGRFLGAVVLAVCGFVFFLRFFVVTFYFFWQAVVFAALNPVFDLWWEDLRPTVVHVLESVSRVDKFFVLQQVAFAFVFVAAACTLLTLRRWWARAAILFFWVQALNAAEHYAPRKYIKVYGRVWEYPFPAEHKVAFSRMDELFSKYWATPHEDISKPAISHISNFVESWPYNTEFTNLFVDIFCGGLGLFFLMGVLWTFMFREDYETDGQFQVHAETMSTALGFQGVWWRFVRGFIILDLVLTPLILMLPWLSPLVYFYITVLWILWPSVVYVVSRLESEKTRARWGERRVWAGGLLKILQADCRRLFSLTSVASLDIVYDATLAALRYFWGPLWIYSSAYVPVLSKQLIHWATTRPALDEVARTLYRHRWAALDNARQTLYQLLGAVPTLAHSVELCRKFVFNTSGAAVAVVRWVCKLLWRLFRLALFQLTNPGPTLHCIYVLIRSVVRLIPMLIGCTAAATVTGIYYIPRAIRLIFRYLILGLVFPPKRTKNLYKMFRTAWLHFADWFPGIFIWVGGAYAQYVAGPTFLQYVRHLPDRIPTDITINPPWCVYITQRCGVLASHWPGYARGIVHTYRSSLRWCRKYDDFFQ